MQREIPIAYLQPDAHCRPFKWEDHAGLAPEARFPGFVFLLGDLAGIELASHLLPDVQHSAELGRMWRLSVHDKRVVAIAFHRLHAVLVFHAEEHLEHLARGIDVVLMQRLHADIERTGDAAQDIFAGRALAQLVEADGR